MELVIFIGLQGAGKTTFYHERFARTHRHVSKDLMGRKRNKNALQEKQLREAFTAGESVVVDNTNPRVEDREPLIHLGRMAHAEIIGYYFESNVQLSLARNRLRQGKARVPDIAIFATRKRLQPPSYAEGFDHLYHVRIDPDRGFVVTDWRGGRM